MSDNKVFCSGCKHLYRHDRICKFGEIKISPIDGPYRSKAWAKDKNKFFNCKDFDFHEKSACNGHLFMLCWMLDLLICFYYSSYSKNEPKLRRYGLGGAQEGPEHPSEYWVA